MKSKYFIYLCTTIIIFSAQALFANQSNPRFKAVQKYLLEGSDYPEVFKDKSYHLQIRGLAIGDLDRDGQDEVVLQFHPHYLQSPTVVIYRVDKDMKVTRVIEGLAPGPLLKQSNEYLDSHILGLGVDFEVKAKNKNQTPESLKKAAIEATMKSFSSTVEYADWIHADYRSGKGTYIDMTHAKVPNGERNCEHFEFSEVDTIKIDKYKDEKNNSLFVKVGKHVYLYTIDKFLDNGLMDKSFKQLW